MKTNAIFILVLLLASLAFSQQADRTFLWDRGDSGLDFWVKDINCGEPNQAGGANNAQGSKVNFGVNSHQRWPGANSVKFWTHSAFEERCNQNFTAERAEISANGSYRGLGVREGQTLWFGFSDLYTDIDFSHSATLMQFRNNCESGSPSTQIVLSRTRTAPGKEPGRLYISTPQGKKYFGEAIQENVWYDWVIEIKYSKRNDGYMKIWRARVGSNQRLSYNSPMLVYNGNTMKSGDNCPHIRWGVYRWESGDKKPWQIAARDHMMVKYLGPVRIKLGNNLGAEGFNSVIPRSPSGEIPKPTSLAGASFMTPFHLNVGGDVFFEDQTTFLPDQPEYWEGNTITNYVNHEIEGTNSDGLFQSSRSGEKFAFRGNIPNGTYWVRLRFSENFWQKKGKRKFSIEMEGRYLAELDLYAIKGNYTALELEFETQVQDEQLDIEFNGLIDQGLISAISVTQPGVYSPTVSTPHILRLNVGSTEARTIGGVGFQPDQYYQGNTNIQSFSSSVAGTQWQELYSSARSASGGLRYEIPLPEGSYAVRFHLAEQEYTEPGQRTFHVDLEGERIVYNLDCRGQIGFREAIMGQGNTYVGDGNLSFEMIPVQGKPILFGLEIIPQHLFESDMSLANVGVIPEEFSGDNYSSDEILTHSSKVMPELSFSFYPNPTNGYLFIELERAGQVSLYSLSGAVIRSWKLDQGKTSLDISELPSGLYLLAAGEKIRGKVILSR